MIIFLQGKFAIRTHKKVSKRTYKNKIRILFRYLFIYFQFFNFLYIFKFTFLDVPKQEKGEYLFRKVVMSLDLVEEDYFGLQFMDKNQVPHWLDKTKKLKKQIQIYPPTFHFRVKFYTSEPNNLVEELTRYQFFLQLKQDILSSKLPCPAEKAVKVDL